jgi:hypothetical protein
VADPAIENRPLRELFTQAERLSRELIDHLENGFLPKTDSLYRLVEPDGDSPVQEDVEDVTVRNQARVVLESEEFTNKLYKETAQYLTAIDRAVSKMTEQV